jgi:hypothetical protein
MSRKQVIQLFAVSAFVGLLAGIASLSLTSGLAMFVICLVAWGAWQLLTERGAFTPLDAVLIVASFVALALCVWALLDLLPS